MQAIRLEEFGLVQVIQMPEPCPGPGEVLVDVVATGICGSDIHGYTGENKRRNPGQVMGHETVGIVAGLGEGVTELSPGQRVVINPVIIPDDCVDAYRGREQRCPRKSILGVDPETVGAFAEKIVVPVRNAVPLSSTVPLELGALVEPLAVAVHAVRRARVHRDQRVLVLGGGPIGQSVVLALKMLGVQDIVVSEIVRERRELASALGVPAVDPTAGDAAGQIAALLDGPADAAIDTVGIDPTMHMALSTTREGATICLAGMGALHLSLDAFRISIEERIVTGTFTYSAQDFRDAAHWVGTAPPQLGEMVSRIVPPSAVQEELYELAYGTIAPGKVLIRLGPENQ